MRQGFTAVLLLLVGLPWKTELQKAAEDKECEVSLQPQDIYLVSLTRSLFLHRYKWQNFLLQTSTAQPTVTSGAGISQEDKDKDHSSSGKPAPADKVQKFLTRAELLPQPRAGTLKTGGNVSKSLSVLFSCINWPKMTYLSLQLPPWKWESFIKKEFSLSYLDLFCLMLLFHCDFLHI